MKIGSRVLTNNIVFAPMAGITNLPMRLMAKEQGCGLVCSEMISSRGLVQRGRKTLDMLKSDTEERPLSVQIFGSEPDIMAEAAAIVEHTGADIIDINFGCSVKKVLKTGSGAALMKSPELAARIIASVRNAVSIPMTIKIRSGWDASGDQAVTIARIARDNGADAVAVHPRTARQGFSGKADWGVIERLKNRLDIPVIGNGDITRPEHAGAMIAQTGCDGVMVGRAAIGDPWIFSRILAFLNGDDMPVTDYKKQFDAMIRFLETSCTFLGEKNACFVMRGKLGWFAKGLPHSSRFRRSITTISSKAEALEKIAVYRELLTDAIHEETGNPNIDTPTDLPYRA
ncbi:MAG: tRNA dihydrouridine synthase DusB [Desulfobacterales bacterium]